MSDEVLLEAVFQSVSAIARERDFDRLMATIADLGCKLIGCDRVSIWLVDRRAGELWTKVAQGAELIKMPLGYGIVGEAIESAKNIIINEPYDDPRFNRAIDSETGYRTNSILVIPMIGVGGGIIGAFQAINKLNGGFNDRDIARLQLAAAFGSKILDAEKLHLENNLMIEEQLRAAQKQRSIIVNEFEGDPNYEVREFMQASDALSGDTYALYRGKNGALIYCVDGMGHGILPSLTSFSVAATIKQFIHLSESLSELSIKLLNNLRGVLSDEEQLSCAFFWLDPSMKKIDYIVAGFYPPIVQDNGRIIEVISNNAPLMNYTENIKVNSLNMENFEKLLIYTDGLVEDTNFDFHRSNTPSLLDRSSFNAICEMLKKTQMDDDITIVYFGKNNANIPRYDLSGDGI